MVTHTGGAVEMIVTGGIIVSDSQSRWYNLLGYVFLLGNTVCMVRLCVVGVDCWIM